MKAFYSLLFLVITYFYFGQTVELLHQFQDDKLFKLYQHPFEQNMLIGITREWSIQNGVGITNKYAILDIDENQITERTWDNLDSISGNPVLFNELVLFSGHKASSGNELYIWDGNNLTLMDLIPGTSSSDPYIFSKDNVCYISALNGPFRQLYRLETNLTLTQLTFEQSFDATVPIYFDDSIGLYLAYDLENNTSFLQKRHNGSTNTITNFSGGQSSQIKEFNGNYYFNVFDYINNLNDRVNQFGCLNQQGNYTSILSYTIHDIIEEPKIFDFNNELFLISEYEDSLNQSSITTIYKFINDSEYVPHSYFNEQLRVMDVLDFWNSKQFIARSMLDLDKIYAFDGQGPVFIDSSDYHLHFVSDKYNKAYYISVKHQLEDTTMLYEIDKFTLQSQQYEVCDSSDHPPYFYFDKNGGVWLDNILYFIEGNSTDIMTNNIYKFEATLSAVLSKGNTKPQILVCPTIVEQNIQLKGDLHGVSFELVNSQGKIVYHGVATETILLPTLESGMYFLNMKQDSSLLQVEKLLIGM